jgi:DnaK suppressor protein
MPLDDLELDSLRQALIARRAELKARREAHLGGASRVEHAREFLQQERAGESQADAEREVDFALSDREIVELARIDSAMRRLDDGGYGICPDCGEDIPLPRLRLEPEALRCVRCESLRERGLSPPATL